MLFRVSQIFGIITCSAGLFGVIFGSLLAQVGSEPFFCFQKETENLLISRLNKSVIFYQYVFHDHKASYCFTSQNVRETTVIRKATKVHIC